MPPITVDLRVDRKDSAGERFDVGEILGGSA
jgi:hypothetical protein